MLAGWCTYRPNKPIATDVLKHYLARWTGAQDCTLAPKQMQCQPSTAFHFQQGSYAGQDAGILWLPLVTAKKTVMNSSPVMATVKVQCHQCQAI